MDRKSAHHRRKLKTADSEASHSEVPCVENGTCSGATYSKLDRLQHFHLNKTASNQLTSRTMSEQAQVDAKEEHPAPPFPPVLPHRVINVAAWNRKPVFDLYNNGPSPQWGITIRLDVTKLRKLCKSNGWSYLQGSLFVLAKTSNQYEPIRYRIRKSDKDGESEVIVHEKLHPSCPILRKDETYGFCFFQAADSFSEFRAYADATLAHFHAHTKGFHGNRRDDTLHGSVLPWLDFTSYEHAQGNFPMPASIPRYCFGKLVHDESNDTWSQAFCLHVHHGLMDGLHMGRFMELFQRNLDQADELLEK